MFTWYSVGGLVLILLGLDTILSSGSASMVFGSIEGKNAIVFGYGSLVFGICIVVAPLIQSLNRKSKTQPLDNRRNTD